MDPAGPEPESLEDQQISVITNYGQNIVPPWRSNPFPVKRKRGASPPEFRMPRPKLIKDGLPVYVLFECAYGYTLFIARNVDEVGRDFQSTEEYIKRREAFKLIAECAFDDAPKQIISLYNSTPSDQLLEFLGRHLPKPNLVDTNYSLTCFDGELGNNIQSTIKMAFKYSHKLGNVMRGLRTNICSFIKLQGSSTQFQHAKMSTYEGDSIAANSSSSSFNGEVVVVPHEIEGVFIAKGKNKEALLCTKNLVPGVRVYGEQLITLMNEDGIKIEYRVWNPYTSKLAAVIENGSKTIWVRPGSRVFYLGDVCGTTVSHLSDIVGPEGLVYALGKSDSVLHMAEKRSNIIVIYDNPQLNRHRMFFRMVDVICADLTTLSQVHMVAVHATHYLRAGGHCLMSVKAEWVVSCSNGETTLDGLGGLLRRELKLIKVIELEPIIKDNVMAVGIFRNVKA